MADAVRLISISRGYDPRDFALVAFGGAGALHGAAIARELAIPVVIVPPNPGVTSALGCLLVDMQHDFSESYIVGRRRRRSRGASKREFAALETEALERLAHEGVASPDIVLQRTYRHDVSGPVALARRAAPRPIGARSRRWSRRSIEQHEREYNFRRDDAPVSLFRLNLKAIGVVPKAELAVHEPTGAMPEPASRRPVWFDGDTAFDTPVY